MPFVWAIGLDMPSQEHESILELFRNRPLLAPEMLEEVFEERLPPFREVRIDSENITEIVPRELRADLVVNLVDEAPVLTIVVEVQLNSDPDKEYVWPTYVTGARMRHRCPACVLVVVPDPTLAKRLARPILVGPGPSQITPLVLGPRSIPAITDVEEAKERPELAVLSAMAYGDSEVAIPVALAALAASAGLEADKQRVYGDAVFASLNVAARLALEALMAIPNYEYRSEFARKYYKQGKDDGLSEGLNEGRNEGRNEGLAPLVHLLERRLRRPLTTKERVAVDVRLRKDGAIVVGDVVLDWSSEDLEGWLAATPQQ